MKNSNMNTDDSIGSESSEEVDAMRGAHTPYCSKQSNETCLHCTNLFLCIRFFFCLFFTFGQLVQFLYAISKPRAVVQHLQEGMKENSLNKQTAGVNKDFTVHQIQETQLSYCFPAVRRREP